MTFGKPEPGDQFFTRYGVLRLELQVDQGVDVWDEARELLSQRLFGVVFVHGPHRAIGKRRNFNPAVQEGFPPGFILHLLPKPPASYRNSPESTTAAKARTNDQTIAQDGTEQPREKDGPPPSKKRSAEAAGMASSEAEHNDFWKKSPCSGPAPSIPVSQVRTWPRQTDISGKTLLQRQAAGEAIYEYRQDDHEGYFLDSRDRTVNWELQTNGSNIKASAMKVAYDLPSVYAMAHSMMRQMEEAGSQFAVVTAEYPNHADYGEAPPPTRAAHEFTTFRAATVLPENEALQGNTASGSNIVRPSRQERLQPEVEGGQAAALAKLECSVCKKDHHVDVCNVTGSILTPVILSCLFCNSNDHETEECSTLREVDFADPRSLRYYLYDLPSKRASKPRFSGYAMNEFNFLYALKLASLLEEGFPDQSAEDLPWTPQFTRNVMESSRGKDMLEGRVHLKDFKHGMHTIRHLPRDPFWKGKTLGDVLELWESSAQSRDQMIGTVFSSNMRGKISKEIGRQLHHIGLLGENNRISQTALTKLQDATSTGATRLCEELGDEDGNIDDAARLLKLPPVITTPFLAEEKKDAAGNVLAKHVWFRPERVTAPGLDKDTYKKVWAAICKLIRRGYLNVYSPSEAERELHCLFKHSIGRAESLEFTNSE
ncbi:hypothetical protein QBC34DRAFT_476301 [Podospora aff. communis PSN243]|uniref:Uncharacterized protein n=1 Tax=Podospora aff. communis PSN243 TaxID=3040156 RepID=A0AAV9G7W6_9PEZI|nr:hypothetical protein QBC34DRAFT_476301 [Podospora aff. communis PSN243]